MLAKIIKNWDEYFYISFLGAMGGIMVFFNRAFMVDDAYILLTYANNLVKYGQWTFNGIEKSNGATSILYVLLLALGGIFKMDIGRFSVLLNIIIWVFWSILTYKLLEALIQKKWIAFLGAAVVITFPFFTVIFRMESHLLMLFMTWSLLSYVNGKYTKSAIFLGLAFLTRPDSLVLGLLQLLHFIWIRKEKLSFKLPLFFLAVITPWLIYSMYNFGSLFPGTLSAKIGQGQSGFWPILYIEGFWELIKNTYIQMPMAGLLIVIFITAYVFYWALFDRKINGGGLIIMVGYIFVYYIAYGFILKVPGYPWYYGTTLFFLLIICVKSIYENPFFKENKLFAEITATIILLAILQQHIANNLPIKLQANPHGHVSDYRVIGEYLRDNTPLTTTIGATEVGVLSWYSKRPIFDNLGLNDKKMAGYITSRDTGLWLLEKEPDYLLFNEPPLIWQQANPYQPWSSVPWFRDTYTVVKSFDLFRGKYYLYKKTGNIKESREKFMREIPTIAFPLSYDREQLVLGISPFWKEKILNTPKLADIKIKNINNLKKLSEGVYESINGDPMLELSTEFSSYKESGKFFLKIKMKSKLNILDSPGEVFITTKDHPVFTAQLSLRFRSNCKDQEEIYYIPLYSNLENKWLDLREITNLRFDPIAESAGRIEIKSIELCAF